MTGFGRTGFVQQDRLKTGKQRHEDVTVEFVFLFSPLPFSSPFACHAAVQPDFLALAKGMTGGYLPWPRP